MPDTVVEHPYAPAKRPYGSEVAMRMLTHTVTFYVPSEDVAEVLADPSYLDLARNPYLREPMIRTTLYGCNNDPWLEEFRFSVWACDWWEFESQPCVLSVKEHLQRLERRYRSSAHREGED